MGGLVLASKVHLPPLGQKQQREPGGGGDPQCLPLAASACREVGIWLLERSLGTSAGSTAWPWA